MAVYRLPISVYNFRFWLIQNLKLLKMMRHVFGVKFHPFFVIQEAKKRMHTSGVGIIPMPGVERIDMMDEVGLGLIQICKP